MVANVNIKKNYIDIITLHSEDNFNIFRNSAKVLIFSMKEILVIFSMKFIEQYAVNFSIFYKTKLRISSTWKLDTVRGQRDELSLMVFFFGCCRIWDLLRVQPQQP